MRLSTQTRFAILTTTLLAGLLSATAAAAELLALITYESKDTLKEKGLTPNNVSLLTGGHTQ